MAEEPIYTTREDYFRELGVLSGKIRRRRRLRSEYFSLMASLRRYLTVSRYYAVMRSIRALLEEARRLEWMALTVSPEIRIELYRRISNLYAEREKRLEEMAYIRKERAQRLEAMRHIREDIIPPLEAEIEAERRRISRKKIPPPPPKKVLVRIKIRLYNESREPTPTGQFQTFWDIDAIMDPETELIDWEYWLTREEIQIAKYHMVGYFKGMGKWREPEQMTLAYFTDPKGIPSRSDIAVYGKSHKNVPAEFVMKAADLTIEELIVGISSVEPEPNHEPTSDNMGCFFERAMIIKDDMVVWDEVRNKWAWKPTNYQVERVKEELK